MDFITILSVLAMAGAAPPASADPAPPAAAPDPWLGKEFLYYRAVAFREMVAGRMCGGGPVLAEFNAISLRLEKARARLSRQSRSSRFDRKEDTAPPEPQCNDAKAQVTLRGFQNAVAELEAVAK